MDKHEQRKRISDILVGLIEDNRRYIKKDRTPVYDNLRDRQTPEITLVMCSDSRIPTAVFKPNTINHVFCIENMGNQIRTSEGSVDYGVLCLKTPVLVILGHTGCGAVAKSFEDFSGETEAIRRELQFMKEGLESMKKYFSEDDPERLNKYDELNVDFQVKYALHKYHDLVQSGDLTIVGMMVDITHSFHGADCEEYITNINGATDVDAIKRMNVLEGIDGKILDDKVKVII